MALEGFRFGIRKTQMWAISVFTMWIFDMVVVETIHVILHAFIVKIYLKVSRQDNVNRLYVQFKILSPSCGLSDLSDSNFSNSSIHRETIFSKPALVLQIREHYDSFITTRILLQAKCLMWLTLHPLLSYYYFYNNSIKNPISFLDSHTSTIL